MVNNLLILIFIGVSYVVYLYFRSIENNGIRDAILKAFLSSSLIIWLTTESLGMVNMLSDKVIILCYSSYLIVGLALLKYQNKRIVSIISSDINFIKLELNQYFSGFVKYLFLFFLLVTLFLAIYVAPNNTDALGYHIARVMFWAQNHNLYHYPTEFSPQLYYNVLSEYFFLSLYLLTGSDYFFNCVQWVAMLIILIGASKLLQVWGQPKAIQGLGAIFTLVIPQVVLQSSSSQNDLLSASYFSVFVYFGYKIVVNKFTYNDYYWGLLAFFLGGFTKYSIFILGFPLICFFGLYQIYIKPLRAIYLGLLSIFFFIGIFGLFFYRNYLLMDELIAPTSQSPLFIGNYTSEIMSWKSFISNLLKIAGNHLALPVSYWNSLYNDFVIFIHKVIDFPLNSSLNSLGRYVTSFTIGEDFSGNFIHFLSVLIFVLIIAWNKASWKWPQIRLFALLFIGFCLYALVFKWQRFHARTQMPFFVVAAPIMIFYLTEKFKLTANKIRILAILFFVHGLPFLVFNSIKPIIPINYIVKRSFNYLPLSISVNQVDSLAARNLMQLKIYKPGDSDFELTKISDLSNEQARLGFGILDRNGVFEQDKLWIGSHSERFSHYVLYNHARYRELEGIFRALGPHRKHVGFQSNSSFVSPFFFMGKALIGQDFQMKYIQYPSLFLGHCNAQERFQYDAILSDNPTFIAKIPTHLGKVIRFKTWTLVLLKRPSSHVFLER